jgi:hypothetical protein
VPDRPPLLTPSGFVATDKYLLPPCVDLYLSVLRTAADFRRCKWPSPLDPLDDSVAKHFDKLNDAPVAAALKAFPTARILSFSHFLPFQQLIPEKRML